MSLGWVSFWWMPWHFKNKQNIKNNLLQLTKGGYFDLKEFSFCLHDWMSMDLSSSVTRLGEIFFFGYFLLALFYIKSRWVQMFTTFNFSFSILATVLATFPYIGQIFVQFSGLSNKFRENEQFEWNCCCHKSEKGATTLDLMTLSLLKSMFEERKVCYSAFLTNLVRWHASAVSFP